MEYICLICKEGGIDKTFDKSQSLSRHLNATHKCKPQEYYDKYLKKEGEGLCQNPSCPHGNPSTSFQYLSKGYSLGCCNSCSQQVPSVRKKTEETNIKKYGTISPTQNKDILKKRGDNFEKKYGVRNPMQTKEFKYKSIKTRMDKSDEIQLHREQSNLKKYGVKNVMLSPIIANKLSEIFVNRSKDDVVNRLGSLGFETVKYTKCTAECLLKCKKCGNNILIKPAEILYNNRIFVCDVCFPDKYGYMQNEIFDFVSSVTETVIKNDRFILDGKEIDILLPDYNFGIEFNGLYWHGESKIKDRNYHRDKTILADKKNIELIQIFEDEWLYKTDIVKSMLNYRLHKTNNVIYGRDTSIEFISFQDAVDFMNINHIQSSVASKINIGLIYKNELVALLVVNKPRFNNNYEWEILRFCNKLDSYVIGGFSKLLKFFISDSRASSIISYADARFGKGNVYLKNGFNKINHSKSNYFYVNKHKRESRMKYQKHKLKSLLENFNPDLTEWENMQSNGFDRIWDCGNYVFEWKYR